MLAVCVIYKHHRELELFSLIHSYKADNSRCGFFTAADNIRDKVGIFVVDKVYKVAAVIDDDIGSDLDNLRRMCVIFLRSSTVPRKYVKSAVYKRRRNIVLR